MIKLGRFFDLTIDENKNELIIEDRNGGRYIIGIDIKWLGRYDLAKSKREKPKLKKIIER